MLRSIFSKQEKQDKDLNLSYLLDMFGDHISFEQIQQELLYAGGNVEIATTALLRL